MSNGRNQGRSGGWRQRLKEKTESAVVLSVNDAIHVVEGFANTFLVVTPGGNVVIDTSRAEAAPRHRELLRAIDDGPIRHIILTHAHYDHRGGLAIWREPGTEVIAHRGHVELRDYMSRLDEFFSRRSAAQFGFRTGQRKKTLQAEDPGPDLLFDDRHRFELGGIHFELFHTPGETPDAITVWIPEHRAAFVGDNFYNSFPNLYTLRGTRPRWPLNYITSLEQVMELGPEILLPSHGKPIVGADNIRQALEKYLDAIRYIHQATLDGMNAGKDVHTLMREVRLPPELEVGEAYGKVEWSVRGIYEGYVGWFDGNPAHMYSTPPREIFADLVELAGGPRRIAEAASTYAAEGYLVEALHLCDVALEADPNHIPTLWARADALQGLLARAVNSNEAGWLRSALRETRRQLD